MHSLTRIAKGLLQGKSPESKRMDFGMLKMTHVWHAIRLKNTSEKFINTFWKFGIPLKFAIPSWILRNSGKSFGYLFAA